MGHLPSLAIAPLRRGCRMLLQLFNGHGGGVRCCPCWPVRCRRRRKILVLGIDYAGKTTLLPRLAQEEPHDETTTIATVGFNTESFMVQGIHLTVWDIGGSTGLRPHWRHYVEGTDALIYVIDSGDRPRFDEAREALHGVLIEHRAHLATTPVLVYANKQDRDQAMTPAELQRELALGTVTEAPTRVQGAVITLGEGVEEGFKWLCGQILSDLEVV